MPKFFHKPLGEIAQGIGAELRGDPDCVISGFSPLESGRPGTLSFLQDAAHLKFLKDTASAAVIVSPKFLESCPTHALVTRNPRLGYAKAVELLLVPPKAPVAGIHPTAIVGQGCVIHPSASIGPYCVIGDRVHIGADSQLSAHVQVGDDSRIGARAFIYPQVSIYHEVFIGDRALIHSGTVIGSDGFGFAPDHLGQWHKVLHFGCVRIGNQVEIGANVTIDRGAMEDTCIGDGVILDNQIQIAHNVQIGAHTAIAGCTGIAGSAKIGAHCMIGGGSCINGHIRIADKVHISGMSMVTHSIEKSGVYSSGMPVKENSTWLRNVARFHHLDEMAKRLKQVEKRLGDDEVGDL